MKKPFYKVLYIQVLIAIACGVAIGYYQRSWGIMLEPLGLGFIKLIKMIIGPVIFCTVVSGIASMQDLKKVGRVGGKALIYFEVMSTLALMIGMVVANVIHPGSGFNADPSTIDAKSITQYTSKANAANAPTAVDFIMNIIPDTFVGAFTRGDILPVLLIAILTGFSISTLGEQGKPVLRLVDDLSKVIFSIVDKVMRLAPIGAFGAMGYTVGKFGIDSLQRLALLIGTFYLTSGLFVLVVLGLVARFTGFSIFKFIAYIKEELLIVLGASSSESALPSLMAKLERLGCSKSVVGLVVPTGYSFNLDGTSIYMTLAALFVAQATNTDLSISQQLAILITAMATSKGAAGISGSGFVTLVLTLQAVPSIPVEGMALILGIDRFMSECRALTNFVGNGVATLVVSKWERELDLKVLHEELNQR